MQYKTLTSSFLLLIVLLLPGACRKFDKQGYLPQPGIAITFDDNYVNNWHKYLPLLDSLGIKATFYVSGYHQMNAEQVNKLRAIQHRGHEIAYHTLNHYNLVDYVYKYHRSIPQMIQQEIMPGLLKMNQDGFYPKTFAYPFGSHCASLDKALLPYFKSVRALNGTTNYGLSQAATEKNEVLYGLGLDISSKNSDAIIGKMLTNAKDKNTCAVLVAHRINAENTNLTVTLDRLRAISAQAKSLGLKFYCMSEISQ
jgi:peptidoglycan-N-acetylglucosamine deacetylase